MTLHETILSIIPTGEFKDYRKWGGPLEATYTVTTHCIDTAYVPWGAPKKTKPRPAEFSKTMVVDAGAGWLRTAVAALFRQLGAT